MCRSLNKDLRHRCTQYLFASYIEGLLNVYVSYMSTKRILSTQGKIPSSRNVSWSTEVTKSWTKSQVEMICNTIQKDSSSAQTFVGHNNTKL